MFEPLTRERYSVALDLLAKGFPHRTRDYWESAIERIERFCRGGPVGQFLVIDDKPVGVVLTLHNERTLNNGRVRRSVNMSGWCIEPEYRSHAPFMLHGLLKPDVDVYTDLTPSKDVSTLLKAIGFKSINRGVSVVVLPYMAVAGPATGEVRDFSELPQEALPSHTAELLSHHVEFGAIAAAFFEGTSWQPLIFTSRIRARVPMLELLYCEDNRALVGNLGAVSKFLLRRGKSLLTLDIPLESKVPGIHMTDRGMKFTRGETIENQTDYAGSELFLLDL